MRFYRFLPKRSFVWSRTLTNKPIECMRRGLALYEDLKKKTASLSYTYLPNAYFSTVSSKAFYYLLANRLLMYHRQESNSLHMITGRLYHQHSYMLKCPSRNNDLTKDASISTTCPLFHSNNLTF